MVACLLGNCASAENQKAVVEKPSISADRVKSGKGEICM